MLQIYKLIVQFRNEKGWISIILMCPSESCEFDLPKNSFYRVELKFVALTQK